MVDKVTAPVIEEPFIRDNAKEPSRVVWTGMWALSVCRAHIVDAKTSFRVKSRSTRPAGDSNLFRRRQIRAVGLISLHKNKQRLINLQHHRRRLQIP